MLPFVWTLITPAFIASIVTIGINLRAEKIRARREYFTSSFQHVQAVIDRAIAAAAEYFPAPAAERNPKIEAKLWMADRELRFALPTLIKNANQELVTELENLRDAFDDLVALLTGGSFQSVAAASDLKQLRLIASAGSELRAKLSDVRHAELRLAVDSDPISRVMKFFSDPLEGVGH